MSKQRSANVPTSSTAVRIAAVLHRRPDTPWNEKKEIEPFRRMSKTVKDEDLTLVERYYAVNWPPRTSVNHLRHDLATLINNWQGEVDRARIWCEAHPKKQPPRVIIPLPRSLIEPEPLSEEEKQASGDSFAKLMGRRPLWETKT